MAEKIAIFDTTLRDGEQAPGCSLTFPEKIEIAHQLARLGVDVIEAGFPISSPGDFQAVQTIARHKYSLILTAHSHLYAHDPDAFGGRSAIVGLGGAPSSTAPGFGTVLQNRDGSLTFVRRDANGNPIDVPWTVAPQ